MRSIARLRASLLIPGGAVLVALAGCGDPSGLNGGAAAMRASGGVSQVAPLGRPVHDSLEVTLTDLAGRPVKGVQVAWSTADGRISDVSLTDDVGHARAAWTLGLASGTQHARASVAGLDPVEFTAAGTAFQAAQLTGGGSHACALTDDHRIFCWRRADFPDPGLDTVPTLVPHDGPFARVAAGSAHTCALDTGGTAWCWGDNSEGQLGDGSFTPRDKPVAVPGGPWVGIYSGSTAYATCALVTSHQAWCWGSLTGGFPPLSRVTAPTLVGPVPIRSLSVGLQHICGIGMAGGAWCWGKSSDGAIGAGPTEEDWALVPTPVSGPAAMDAVEVGAIQSCGIASRRPFCWGADFYSALGSPGEVIRYAPSAVAGGLEFTSLSLVVRGAYALDAEGVGYRWGSPGGCCDLGGPATPAALPGGVALDTLVATGNGACGLTRGTHDVICWTPAGADDLEVAAPAALTLIAIGSPAPPAPSTPAAPERTRPALPSPPRR
jgi:hypothetical protein